MAHTASRKMSLTGVLTTQDVRVRRDLRDFKFLYSSIALAVVLVAVLFGYIWSRLLVVNMGYEISRATSVRSALIEQNRRLRVEFMRLKSPERVERMASAELGLVHPAAEQIVNVR